MNKAFPGMNCGDPRCGELCAEVYDAAKAMRLEPAEALRKTIERELQCRPADRNRDAEAACRFGFMPERSALVLSGERKNENGNIIRIFRNGVDECKKCQALEGTRITPEVWADESKMKAKGSFPNSKLSLAISMGQ